MVDGYNLYVIVNVWLVGFERREGEEEEMRRDEKELLYRCISSLLLLLLLFSFHFCPFPFPFSIFKNVVSNDSRSPPAVVVGSYVCN